MMNNHWHLIPTCALAHVEVLSNGQDTAVAKMGLNSLADEAFGWHRWPNLALLNELLLCGSVCQTFMTLSVSDMANRVQLSGPHEAEKYILHMVS